MNCVYFPLRSDTNTKFTVGGYFIIFRYVNEFKFLGPKIHVNKTNRANSNFW